MFIPIFILSNFLVFIIYSDITSNATIMGNTDTVEKTEYLFTSKVYIEPITQQKTLRIGEDYQVNEKVITYGDEFLLSETNINKVIETLKNSNSLIVEEAVLKDIKNSISRSNNFVTLSTSYIDRNLAQLFHECLVLSYSEVLNSIFHVLNSTNKSENNITNNILYIDGKVVVIENAIPVEIRNEPITVPPNSNDRWIVVRILISLILASLISIMLILFFEVRDPTITSIDQLKVFMDRNQVLGWIPLYKEGILSIDFISACIYGNETSEKERFLEIGANFENIIDFQNNKVFLLGGTTRGEGKSLLNYLLAIYFSQVKNICLLELNNSWNITTQYSDININLSNGRKYSGKEIFIKNTKIHVFHIDFNSIEYFRNHEIYMLEELKCNYDMLFIEAPSLDSPYLLSQYLKIVDQVILPIRMGITRSDNFKLLVQLCERYKRVPLIVLNGVVPALQPDKSIVRIQNAIEINRQEFKNGMKSIRALGWSKIVYAMLYKPARKKDFDKSDNL